MIPLTLRIINANQLHSAALNTAAPQDRRMSDRMWHPSVTSGKMQSALQLVTVLGWLWKPSQS